MGTSGLWPIIDLMANIGGESVDISMSLNLTRICASNIYIHQAMTEREKLREANIGDHIRRSIYKKNIGKPLLQCRNSECLKKRVKIII